MVEMKPLEESRISFSVSGFCALGRKRKAPESFLDHGRDIYALAWAGRQVEVH